MPNFAGRSSLRTWLVQIMTRQAAKAWRRSRNHRNSVPLRTENDTQERDDSALLTQSTTGSVDHRLDIMKTLQAMPAPHREVLVLREIRGMSYDEMAQTLGVPRGTVESRLSRARADFRQRLDGAIDVR